MRTLRLLATLVGSLLAAAPAGAQQVTVGTANNSNCIPFGCDFDVSRYQQVYAGGAFGGPVQITSLAFLLGSAPNSFLSPVTYTVRLGYTAAPVGGLNALLDANVAGGLTTFATRSFGIGPAAPPVLTFTGLTPFTFDPAAGNLLLDILVDGQVGADVGGWASYASDNSGAVTSRAFVQGGLAGGDATGLVTQFGLVSAASTVPEPSTVVLLGAGLLGVAGVGARRRSAAR